MVARGLNRGNEQLITTAVQALEPSPGATLADLGFGGGLGLRLLLNAADELDRARRRGLGRDAPARADDVRG